MYMIKCDRCGNYEKTNSPNLLYLADKKNDHEYSIVRFKNEGVDQITLCKNCERALTKFIYSYPTFYLTSADGGEQ